jgi:hypothetical protein
MPAPDRWCGAQVKEWLIQTEKFLDPLERNRAVARRVRGSQGGSERAGSPARGIAEGDRAPTLAGQRAQATSARHPR